MAIECFGSFDIASRKSETKKTYFWQRKRQKEQPAAPVAETDMTQSPVLNETIAAPDVSDKAEKTSATIKIRKMQPKRQPDPKFEL